MSNQHVNLFDKINFVECHQEGVRDTRWNQDSMKGSSLTGVQKELNRSYSTGAQNITLSHQQPIHEDKGVPYVKKVL